MSLYGSIFKNSDQNTNYRMLILGQELPNFQDILDNAHSINIDHLFPMWMLDRSAGSTNVTSLFIQTYYNWLYNNSGYKLNKTAYNTVGLRELLDIKQTSVEMLKHFVFTYAPSFPTQQINEDNADNIKVFITNIRRDLYQRKSNEEAYFYFFNSLYNTSEESEKPINVSLEYPKIKIFRLNGGRFEHYGWSGYQGETGDYGSLPNLLHLGGSYLNGHILQDSEFYQDYSYVLMTESDIDPDSGLPIYQEALMDMLHPVGIKAFLEMTIKDYIPPDDYDPEVDECETPVIGNYFAYRLNDGASKNVCSGCTVSGDGWSTIFDGPTAMFYGVSESNLGGMTGWTYGDAWARLGTGGIVLPYNMPTYTYPEWSEGITGDESQYPFNNIDIGNMLYLCPLEYSLNLGITGCTAPGEPTSC